MATVDAATAVDAAVVVPDAAVAMVTPIDAGPTRRRDAGPVARPDAAAPLPPIDAAPPAVVPDAGVIDAAPARATLAVEMDAWCDLSIDGVDEGRADRKRRYPVDAGRHVVVCSQGRGMPEWRGEVTVAAGGHEVVRGSLLGKVAVTVTVTGGDAVRIDGTRHGNGAEVALRPGRYKVEVLSGSRVVDTAYVSVPRGARCTLRDRPDLGCF
ncbi:MAG: hypothetical protein H6708_15065 [Kofleriaceae bacterium]|nr:hypothetical protein [Kofleriaceae bacterium]